MDIAKFVADAPPGEIEAVKRDIEIITDESSAVARELATELETVNVAKLRSVKLAKVISVVSMYNQLSKTKFFSGTTTFEYDHVAGTVKDSTPDDHEVSTKASVLKKKLLAYVLDHYPAQEGRVAEVFDYDDKLAIVIRGRRLSPSNFHNGQWTSQYVVDGESISGRIDVDVHFFEDGNVRLKSGTDVKTSADNVIAAIEKAENSFETQLHKSLRDLNETEFKALRRALPVTRERMDWTTTAAQYKLGRELGA